MFLYRGQAPTYNSTLRGRVILDLFSEPDIFSIKWDALNNYNGILYPALPDLYGPTMNVRSCACPLPFTTLPAFYAAHEAACMCTCVSNVLKDDVIRACTWNHHDCEILRLPICLSLSQDCAAVPMPCAATVSLRCRGQGQGLWPGQCAYPLCYSQPLAFLTRISLRGLGSRSPRLHSRDQ
jgi:hypothetical protein